MTDPLLTIEDATREFRVSPKTIRRRLTSGEIVGAYKRPGHRGPEWVMPRQSLADAGFTPRPLATPTAVPTEAEERASYWEQRAIDAEAALQADGHDDAPRRRGLGGLGWALIGVGLVLVLIVGVLVLQSRDGSAPEPDTRGAGAMGTVAALLEQETELGDAIGLVGERRTDAIPAGRVVAPSPRAGWESPAGPRFVVATFDDSAPPPAVASLRSSADTVLRTPHGGLTVEVFDRTSRRGGETQDRSSSAPETAGEPAPLDPTPDASGPAPGTDPDPASPAPADRVPASDAVPATPPGEAEVLEGDSFWSIAAATVSAELGVDAPTEAVTAYWSALLSANADRLVEPGNPDLLHVGQTVVLPPLP